MLTILTIIGAVQVVRWIADGLWHLVFDGVSLA